MNREDFDYIIVGSGSAGCVLAARLTEDAGARVLLLEAGPKDGSWKIDMPAALIFNLCDERYNWYYHTTPQPMMNDRPIYCPRGRVWGGSSALNAMAYVRGNAMDFDRWESEGAAGWGYRNVLPYFRRSETYSEGGDDYRGDSGPLKVTAGMRDGTPYGPLYPAFVEAGVAAGYPRTGDQNGQQQEGFGRMDMTISGGVRQSTARTYLRPALGRSGLLARARARALRVVTENGRATGVEIADGSARRVLRASREVILSAGAINSPQLLMLSGIGPADELKAHGIDAVCDLPGVGRNLQDHLELYVQHECKKPVTLFRSTQLHKMALAGVTWFLTKSGDSASAHLEAGAFIRSRAGVTHPDIQYHFLPSVVNDHGREMYPGHAYQAHVGTMRPTSRGKVTLSSADPLAAPLIDPNYLADEGDLADLRACVKLTREIFAQKPFDEFRGREIQPGDAVRSDAEIDDWIRAKADTAYHVSCTCRMGAPDDPEAVVDENGRVRGVDGLRVVDSSIMPSMSSGNLNAPTIMIAEKISDDIRGRPPLAPSEAPVYRADPSTQR